MRNRYSKIYYNRTNTCDICGKDFNEVKKLGGHPRREYNKAGDWTGKWLCTNCYNTFRNHGTYKSEIKETKSQQKKKEVLDRKLTRLNRKCSKCGNDTYIDNNGYQHWYKEYRNGHWDGKSYICTICNNLDQIQKPDSWYNIVKQVNTNRSKVIDIYDFNNLNNYQKGLLIEILVCRTIGAINRNIKEDNYKSKTDTLCHNTYGLIEIKGSSLHFHNDYRYSFGGLLGRKFDNLIAVCMDDKVPWKRVNKVYIIPIEKLQDRDIIHIYIDHSDFESYIVDKRLYDNIWQKILEERYVTLKEDKC